MNIEYTSQPEQRQSCQDVCVCVCTQVKAIICSDAIQSIARSIIAREEYEYIHHPKYGLLVYEICMPYLDAFDGTRPIVVYLTR